MQAINYGRELQRFMANQAAQAAAANPALQGLPPPQSPVPPGMTEDEVRVVARCVRK